MNQLEFREPGINIKVGFFGLTHLSIITASVLSSFGVKTVCYSVDSDLITQMRLKHFPIREPGLEQVFEISGDNILFVDNLECLEDCDVIYLAIDTPTDEHGVSNLNHLRESLFQVSKLFPSAVIVILSQVFPGFTEEISKKVQNKVYYQVETLIFGDAISQSKFPSRLIIGTRDEKISIDARLQSILDLYNCPVIMGSYRMAELVKISINLFLASDIVMTNTLADICEGLQVDWSEVREALLLDPRIGKDRYLVPGLGISGGNLERDLRTAADVGACVDKDISFVNSIILANHTHREWVIRKLESLRLLSKNIKYGIWGLAYKANTDSLKNAASLSVLDRLPPGAEIQIHDPWVKATNMINRKYSQLELPIPILESVDVLLILTPWAEYKNYAFSNKLSAMNGKFIIDPYRVLSPEFCHELGIKYVTRGM